MCVDIRLVADRLYHAAALFLWLFQKFPFSCPFRWLLHGDRQQECPHVWEAGLAVITQWLQASLQPCIARMLKKKKKTNVPSGAASFLSAAANKVLSFWWALFWSFYKSWWHAWRKANISELPVFPQNSHISTGEKLKLLSLSLFQLCLCSLAACEAVWCHHGVSDKNGCSRNIFLWQLNFNGVCNFTEFTMARETWWVQHWDLGSLGSIQRNALSAALEYKDGLKSDITRVLTLKLWCFVTFLHLAQCCWKPSVENQLHWVHSSSAPPCDKAAPCLSQPLLPSCTGKLIAAWSQEHNQLSKLRIYNFLK